MAPTGAVGYVASALGGAAIAWMATALSKPQPERTADDSAGSSTASADPNVVTTRDELRGADAVVLGSGVHMGGMESSMRVFFERTAPLWLGGELVGKLGAAFTSSGEGGRGGGELTLVSLLAYLAENGMLLVPMHNRMAGFRAGGCHWGPLAHTNPVDGVPGPSEGELEAARSHGRHVAECTRRWLAGTASP